MNNYDGKIQKYKTCVYFYFYSKYYTLSWVCVCVCELQLIQWVQSALRNYIGIYVALKHMLINNNRTISNPLALLFYSKAFFPMLFNFKSFNIQRWHLTKFFVFKTQISYLGIAQSSRFCAETRSFVWMIFWPANAEITLYQEAISFRKSVDDASCVLT